METLVVERLSVFYKVMRQDKLRLKKPRFKDGILVLQSHKTQQTPKVLLPLPLINARVHAQSQQGRPPEFCYDAR